jgi:hypothetical protein
VPHRTRRLLSRGWRAIADPPGSNLVTFLRNFAIPVGVLLFVVRLSMGPMWGPGLPELVWMFVLVAVARQRDDARRALVKDIARLLNVQGNPGPPSAARTASPVPDPGGEPHPESEAP